MSTIPSNNRNPMFRQNGSHGAGGGSKFPAAGNNGRGLRRPGNRIPARQERYPRFTGRMTAANKSLLAPGGRGSFGGQQQQQRALTERPQVATRAANEQEKESICMEDVMKDLRILEAQQRESEYELSQARRSKQMHADSLAHLQEELQSIKYKNGQEQALVNRMRDLLSQGYRSLQDTKGESDNVRRNLDHLNAQLQMALRTKRSILQGTRNLDRLMTKLRRASSRVEQRRQEAEEKFSDVKEELERAKKEDGILHHSLQQHIAQGRHIQADLVQARSRTSVLDNNVSALERQAAEKLREIELLEKKLLEEGERHKDALQHLTDDLEKQVKHQDELKESIQEKTTCVASTKDCIHQTSEHLMEIQGAQGLNPARPPAGTMQLPEVQLSILRDLVLSEKKASEADQCSKTEIEANVATIRQELEKVRLETTEKNELVAKLQAENKGAKTIEEDRYSLYQAFLKKFRDAKIAIADHQTKIRKLQEERDQGVVQAKDNLRVARDELATTKETLVDTTEQLESIQKALDEVLDLHSRSGSFQELQEKLKLARQRIKQLDREKGRVESECRQVVKTSVTSFDLDENASLEDIKQEIDEMISEFPSLENIDFSFDAGQSTEEQAEIALDGLRQQCQKRLNSAAKVRSVILDVKEQEEKERIRLQEAMEEDERRKARVRERRNHQLTGVASRPKEAESERKRREKRQRRKEKKRELKLPVANPALQSVPNNDILSAAKPRVLLDSFSQVSSGLKADEVVDGVTPTEPLSTGGKTVRWKDGVTSTNGVSTTHTKPRKRSNLSGDRSSKGGAMGSTRSKQKRGRVSVETSTGHRKCSSSTTDTGRPFTKRSGRTFSETAKNERKHESSKEKERSKSLSRKRKENSSRNSGSQKKSRHQMASSNNKNTKKKVRSDNKHVQTSGISSMEGAPKALRNKKSTAVKKAFNPFGNESDFAFLEPLKG